MGASGHCLCGKVTYELSGEPIATAVCHCSHCQRQSGGAFSVNVIALPDQLTVTGELGTYVETGENDDGEYVHRRFCPSCGSPIVSEMLQAGIVAVKAGTLDDPSWVKPDAHIWCDEKMGWVVIEDGPAQMPRNPG